MIIVEWLIIVALVAAVAAFVVVLFVLVNDLIRGVVKHVLRESRYWE